MAGQARLGTSWDLAASHRWTDKKDYSALLYAVFSVEVLHILFRGQIKSSWPSCRNGNAVSVLQRSPDQLRQPHRRGDHHGLRHRGRHLPPRQNTWVHFVFIPKTHEFFLCLNPKHVSSFCVSTQNMGVTFVFKPKTREFLLCLNPKNVSSFGV